jgi:hypothetical protein
MTDAVSTSETPANFYETTRRNVPENNHFWSVTDFNLGLKVITFTSEVRDI